jgi:hypothetical protein
MTSWEVHCFHININIGDAAIHLRVSPVTPTPPTPINPNPPSPTKQFSVDRAVLMDGGKNSTFSVDQIDKTIAYIETKYDIPGGKLLFDSIVLTHWDDDHYGGLFRLIQYRSSSSADGKQKSTCAFMKYNADTHLPETVMYVPYWVNPGYTETDYKEIQNTMWILPNFDDFMAQDDEQYPAVTLPVTPDSGSLAKMKYLSLHAGGFFKPPSNPPPGHEAALRGICKVVATADELIGRDLFDHSLPADGTSATWTAFKDYKALVAAHGRSENGVPGLYCIGADRQQITKPAAGSTGGGVGGSDGHGSSIRAVNLHSDNTARDTGATGDSVISKVTVAGRGESGGHVISVRGLHAIDPKGVIGTLTARATDPVDADQRDNADPPRRVPTIAERFRGVGQEKLVNIEHSVTNRSSIMCVVACNTGVLHYMAGDAEFEREQIAATWLQGIGRIPVMKLSHHGAVYSTPAELLDALQPQYIISPSGTSSRFGHPRKYHCTFINGATRPG